MRNTDRLRSHHSCCYCSSHWRWWQWRIVSWRSVRPICHYFHRLQRQWVASSAKFWPARLLFVCSETSKRITPPPPPYNYYRHPLSCGCHQISRSPSLSIIYHLLPSTLISLLSPAFHIPRPSHHSHSHAATTITRAQHLDISTR